MCTHDAYDRDILSFAAMVQDPELVRNIQIRLKKYGLSVGQVDGLYGSTTANALSTFVHSWNIPDKETNRDIVALLIEKDGLGDGDLGVDLENDPDALDPVVPARILALYFSNRGVDVAAHAQDWHQARKLVNSGFNGLDVFLKCVQRAQETTS